MSASSADVWLDIRINRRHV